MSKWNEISGLVTITGNVRENEYCRGNGERFSNGFPPKTLIILEQRFAMIEFESSENLCEFSKMF